MPLGAACTGFEISQKSIPTATYMDAALQHPKQCQLSPREQLEQLKWVSADLKYGALTQRRTKTVPKSGDYGQLAGFLPGVTQLP